jgi:hypothetical protein
MSWLNAYEYDLMAVAARERADDLRAGVEVVRPIEPDPDAGASRRVCWTFRPCCQAAPRMALGERVTAP